MSLQPLYHFLYAVELKNKLRRVILKNCGTQTVLGLVDFYEIVWLPVFFKMYFVLYRRKECVQIWSNMRVSKMMTELSILVDYPTDSALIMCAHVAVNK